MVRTHGPINNCAPVHALLQPHTAVHPTTYQRATKQGISGPPGGGSSPVLTTWACENPQADPRAWRDLAAKKFTSLIESVVANPNSLSAWDRLFPFSSYCLRAPERGGQWWNLTKVINEQIRMESDPPPPLTPPQAHRKCTRDRDQMESLASLVASKLEGGEF